MLPIYWSHGAVCELSVHIRSKMTLLIGLFVLSFGLIKMCI